MHAKPTRTISLKATLTGVVLLTIGVTAALIHFPWLLTSRKNAESVVTQLNEQVMRGTSQEVGRIFENVISTKQLIRRMLVQESIDLYDEAQMEAFYLNLLEANPNFTWVEFGYPNGDFLASQRQDERTVRIIERRWDDSLGDRATESQIAQRQTLVENFLKTGEWDASQPMARKIVDTYQLEGSKRKLTQQEENPEVYFSPLRPWYQTAVATPGKDAWTDIYVFATGKVPGIDSAITLEKDGKLLGVISIAFKLRQISEYLQNLEVAQQGAIFIVNAKGELLAFTDPEELTHTVVGQDRPKLKLLEQSTNLYLKTADRALRANQVALEDVETLRQFLYANPDSGEKYFVAIKPMNYLDWQVGTVIPESVFLAEINRNQQILFFVVGSLIAIAAVTGVILSDRLIARPILAIADAAAAVEAGDFRAAELDAFSTHTRELKQLARVFQNMVRQVYAREEKLKQQVQELKIEIDEVKRKKQVKEIVDTDFFQDLQTKARNIRQQRRVRPHNPFEEDKREEC